MGTQTKRLNIVLDRELRGLMAELARRRDTSMSALAVEHIRDAIERHEDRLLAELAESREGASRSAVVVNVLKWPNDSVR